MKHFREWETTKRIEAKGYNIKPRGDGSFEIWMLFKLITTVQGGSGLYQFLKEVK